MAQVNCESCRDPQSNRSTNGLSFSDFGVLEVSIYAPYWIHNASGLPLLFRHHGVQNDSRFIRSNVKDLEETQGGHKKNQGTTTVAGQPGEMIDSDGVESSAPASSLEALSTSISMFSDSPSPSMDDDKATTKIESESAFLGNGPRNMGLRELLSGPQGTERPGLREALSVGLVAHRRRFSQEKSKLVEIPSASNRAPADSTQNISLMPAPGILGNDFDNEEEALLKAGVFDDDEIVGLGDRSGNTNSVRPEDLLLLGYSKPESRTGRLSVRLAKGMDSTFDCNISLSTPNRLVKAFRY